MANFILLLAILCAGSSLVSFTADTFGSYGTNWAAEVCSSAPFACQSPDLASYVAAGLGGLWLLMKIAEGMRG